MPGSAVGAAGHVADISQPSSGRPIWCWRSLIDPLLRPALVCGNGEMRPFRWCLGTELPGRAAASTTLPTSTRARAS